MPFGIGPGGSGSGGGATDLEGLSDVDLTSPADDDFLQRKSGLFVNRTVAQVQSDLGVARIQRDTYSTAGNHTWTKPSWATTVRVS